jgi:hypothetical protein
VIESGCGDSGKAARITAQIKNNGIKGEWGADGSGACFVTGEEWARTLTNV